MSLLWVVAGQWDYPEFDSGLPKHKPSEQGNQRFHKEEDWPHLHLFPTEHYCGRNCAWDGMIKNNRNPEHYNREHDADDLVQHVRDTGEAEGDSNYQVLNAIGPKHWLTYGEKSQGVDTKCDNCGKTYLSPVGPNQ